MKDIKCPSCGAAVKPETGKCFYCGTQIVKDSDPSQIYSTMQRKPEISDEGLISLIEKLKSSNNSSIPVLIFMIIWCSIAFSIGFTVIKLSGPGIFCFVPFAMGLFGAFLFIMSLQTKIKNNANRQKIINLCKEKNYAKAYEICKSDNTKKLEAIFIGFYRMNDYDFVREQISLLGIHEANKITTAGQTLNTICNYLIVPMPEIHSYGNNDISSIFN